jgi:hypothetical protein
VATKPAIAVVHDATYTRIGAADGLPYNNTQTIAVGCGKIWMGSDKGVAVRDLGSSEWQYLYGPRWHPGSAVHTIAAVPGPATDPTSTSGVMILGTDAGLSIICESLAILRICSAVPSGISCCVVCLLVRTRSSTFRLCWNFLLTPPLLDYSQG